MTEEYSKKPNGNVVIKRVERRLNPRSTHEKLTEVQFVVGNDPHPPVEDFIIRDDEHVIDEIEISATQLNNLGYYEGA